MISRYNVFNIDGVSFSFHAGPILAAPNFTVSSLGVLSSNGAGCAAAFFMDDAPTVNGVAVPPPTAQALVAFSVTPGLGRRRLAQANGATVSFDMLFVLSSLGVPAIPENVLTVRTSGRRHACLREPYQSPLTFLGRSFAHRSRASS